MTPSPRRAKYIVISPVKNEAEHVERTIQSVLSQTLPPHRWILVDDSSTDGTLEILESYLRKYDWMDLVSVLPQSKRESGPASIMSAFLRGYREIKDIDFEFIIKLDGDLELPHDYFEKLLMEFERDERLGIASGMYLEFRGGEWRLVKMPIYHAAGAAKMIRAKCFAEIGGFVPARGWDTIDEIKARARGWKTCHFPELKFCHLKTEGSGRGHLRNAVMLGEIDYLTGTSFGFVLLKVLHRMLFARPFLLAGLGIIWGFVKTWMSGAEPPVSSAERALYRQLLNSRVSDAVRKICIGRRAIPLED